MLTRREVLKQAGVVAALATTAPWWLVRRAHAARDAKLTVWMPVALAPQVDKLLKDQCYAYAKQAGIKESELQYSAIGTGQWLPKMVAALEAGNPPDVTKYGQGADGALSLPGPPPGGHRPGREDAANGRGVLAGLPQYRHVPGEGLRRPVSPSVPGP